MSFDQIGRGRVHQMSKTCWWPIAFKQCFLRGQEEESIRVWVNRAAFHATTPRVRPPPFPSLLLTTFRLSGKGEGGDTCAALQLIASTDRPTLSLLRFPLAFFRETHHQHASRSTNTWPHSLLSQFTHLPFTQVEENRKKLLKFSMRLYTYACFIARNNDLLL